MKRVFTIVAAFLLACLGVLPATMAQAAGSTPRVVAWSAQYSIEPDGTLNVVESFNYDFGTSGDRHGFTLWKPTQESWKPDKSKVRTYDYSMTSITTTTPGVSTAYTTSTATNSRDKNLRGIEWKIGSASQTVPQHVVYTLTYSVKGAITEENGKPLIFWDAIGVDFKNPVDNATVTIRNPGGDADSPKCAVGKNGSDRCTATAEGSTATFTATGITPGDGFTVGYYFPRVGGMDTTPHLKASPAAQTQRKLTLGAVGTALMSAISVAAGALWKRKNGRDERFLGVPPGVIPPEGAAFAIGRDERPTIPVSFAPPRGVTPGEAGMLDDGVVDVRDTSATLVDLAVRGAIKMYADDDKNMRVSMVRPELAVRPHEDALMREIFTGVAVGQEVDLSGRGALSDAHDAVSAELRDMLQAQGWYAQMPRGIAPSGFGSFLSIIIFGGVIFAGSGVLTLVAKLWWMAPFVPLGILVMVIGAWKAKGKRSPVGRAIQDQVEGFRTYMATAEADQIRFEEGEDIFSKYLPWAIAFDLTDRWTKICAQLVEMGRLPNSQPDWYYGPWSYGYFPGHAFDSAIADSVTVPSSDGGSGGSDFGGGGFSGGDGGGGGGGGDW